MSAPVSLVKAMGRRIIPRRIRETRLFNSLKSLLLRHDSIYDEEYYANFVDGPASRSGGVIADTTVSYFAARNVIDVGCGTGAILAAFKALGCETFGLEYSKAGLEYCAKRGIDVMQFNIERDVWEFNRKFDLVISTEVAEHLPASAADRYVDLLAGLSDIVIFTAAPPGQTGDDHVNLQPKAYWVDKFGARDLQLDQAATDHFMKTWANSGMVENWYTQNLMIFQRRPPR